VCTYLRFFTPLVSNLILNINEGIKRNFPRRNHSLINYDDAEKGKIHLNYSCINIFRSERGVYRIHMHTLYSYIYGTWVSLVLGNDFIVYIYTYIYRNIYNVCVCVFIEREGNGSINLQTMFENCTRLLGNRIILLVYIYV